jgi:hypothetical protein
METGMFSDWNPLRPRNGTGFRSHGRARIFEARGKLLPAAQRLARTDLTVMRIGVL